MAAKKRKPIDMNRYSGRFSARLRELREARNLDVTDIVKKIEKSGYDMPASTYYKWENNTTSPPMDAMPYIAEALKLKSVKSLFPPE